MKYLVLFGILFVIYLLWRYERRTGDAPRQPDAPQRPARPARPALPQEMVECPVCRVHLPRADALVDARGRPYCCAEHRRMGAGGA
ncbi:PP0621 family protein [Ramlibacter rhizophilus]|uniref:Preprotein translocase subunit YajC n=1 Tax=Ramlibacter rhizophilus TaxID=1781167 RepID=A0A4Z0BDJ3_9BURK|nr:PP0621 family protein [Ramlibacter rhizophilus]TFY97376.1 hypothetical protein EZ242_17775 [Ramlibacter rhizophilus]